MEVEFDPKKDEINFFKHGVRLLFGIAVLSSLVGEEVDCRQNYGEVRVNAFGIVDGILFVCTYTRRGRAYRFISVRKASQREKRFWLSLELK